MLCAALTMVSTSEPPKFCVRPSGVCAPRGPPLSIGDNSHYSVPNSAAQQRDSHSASAFLAIHYPDYHSASSSTFRA